VPEPRPCRILHVVPRLERGGIETSLVQLLRIVDRQRYRMDFLTLNPEAGSQADEFRALGSRVFTAAPVRMPWRLGRDFEAILRHHGPYDVVQTHTHFSGGYLLRLARRHGVPWRIAHSRNDTRADEARRAWLRRPYVRLMRRWIRAHGNVRIAISRSAAQDLFGPEWERAGVHLIHSGRDFAPYATPAPRAAVRAELGLAEDAFVLGHIGRFDWRKNHPFVVEVADEVFRRVPDARLLLIGDGRTRAEVEALVRDRGLTERVVFAGARDDVPRLVTGAMDGFVFPSHHEGLGLAVVEAQAAGLPCVLADALPEEIDVVPELVHRLPLDAPPAVWAERLLAAHRAPRPAPAAAFRAVRASPFSLDATTARLCTIYDRCVP
jgi:glycosyltransferase involved in cell wall biosynthesis